MECLLLVRTQTCVRAGDVSVNKIHSEWETMPTDALLMAPDAPGAGFPLIAPAW